MCNLNYLSLMIMMIINLLTDPSFAQDQKTTVPSQEVLSQKTKQKLDVDFDQNNFLEKCEINVKNNKKFSLDIHNKKLEEIVKLISCIKLKHIVITEELKGKKVTIYSPVKVSVDEAYQLLLISLEANGFTISKQNQFWKLTKVQAKTDTSLTNQMNNESPMESITVTERIPLNKINTQKLYEVLDLLVGNKYPLGNDLKPLSEVIYKLSSNHTQIVVDHKANSLSITELFRISKRNQSPKMTSPQKIRKRITKKKIKNKYTENIKLLSPNNYEITRFIFEEQFKNSDHTISQARVIPHFKQGKNSGFKLLSIRFNSFLRYIGFKSGDVIQKINGEALGSINHSVNLIQKLRYTKGFNIEFERRGKIKNYQYTIQ